MSPDPPTPPPRGPRSVPEPLAAGGWVMLACVFALALGLPGIARGGAPSGGPVALGPEADPLPPAFAPPRLGGSAQPGPLAASARPVAGCPIEVMPSACGDLASRIERAKARLGGEHPEGAPRGDSTVRLGVASRALVTPATALALLELEVGETLRPVRWRLGAGALHDLKAQAVGFSLLGGVGVGLGDRASIGLEGRFLNVAEFYGDAEARPVRHILGVLTFGYVLAGGPDSVAVEVAAGFVVGATLERVARFYGAGQIIDDVRTLALGGLGGLLVRF